MSKEGNDQSQPIQRREADLLWDTIGELKTDLATARKETRENFQIAFAKLDDVREGFGHCSLHIAKIEDIERRIGEAEDRPNQILKGAYLLLGIAAILIVGIIALIKLY